MKNLVTFTSVVAAGLFLAAGAASAGTLTITSGPTFDPSTAFSNSSIQAQVLNNPPGVNGSVARVTGDVTITPGSATTASVSVAGNYSANAGDRPSGTYSFVVDSNYAGTVSFTVRGSATTPLGPVNVTANGNISRGLNLYKGTFRAPQAFPLAANGTFTATVTLNFTPAANAGAATAPGTVQMGIERFDLQLAPTDAAAVVGSQPLNIATRLAVQTGDNVLIGGFIIQGSAPKKVIIRGIGPSLNFAGALLNPTLELFQGDTSLVFNDDWKQNQQEVQATTIPPTDDRESAIVRTLEPGAYTAILAGKDNTTGVGLVEVYDLDQPGGRLANISSRGFVQTGEDVIIGGFILGPNTTGATRVVVRAIGPSLTGVANALQDPVVELRDSNGDLISSNDNWQDAAEKQTIQDAGLAPTHPNEAALIAVETPGDYTAIVRGVNNTTGVGLVELYHLQ